MQKVQLTGGAYSGWTGALYYTQGRKRLPLIFLDGRATFPDADEKACVAAVVEAFGDRYVVTDAP